MEKVENQAVKKYLINKTSKVLDTCELFTKIFGENFARNNLEKNLNTVYTNGEEERYEAYCDFENFNITIGAGRERIVKPRDIEKDEELMYEMLHEGEHIALAKSHEECEKMGIKAESRNMHFIKQWEKHRGRSRRRTSSLDIKKSRDFA